jgi:hypothetical protein
METIEYFVGGWSKANEIKSFYMYRKFRGDTAIKLIDLVPKF